MAKSCFRLNSQLRYNDDRLSNITSGFEEYSWRKLMRQTTFRLVNLLGCLALIVLFSTIANAQFRAGVQGVVADSAGGAVPGATVTLTNNETNQTQTTTTSDEGFYRFSNLPPGTYSIAAEKTDFKKVLNENIKVDAESIRGV